ncbi:MAG: hypothetical protein M3454_00660 [Actinomycetota bacterium]|nr:hypothetical protein [Actinomycetota bacterium]
MSLVRRWLPPASLILSLVLMAGAAVLYAPVLAGVVNVVDVTFLILLTLTFSATGTFLSRRRPEHPFGPIFSALGAGWALYLFAGAYVEGPVLAGGASGTLANLIPWIGNLVGVPAFGTTVAVLLLLFPTGRPLSPRWRPLVWLTIGVLSVLTIAVALKPGRMESYTGQPFDNPYGVGSERLVDAVAGIGYLLITGCILLAAVSLVLRFMRSRGIERQQLKWMVLAAAFLIVSSLAGVVSEEVGTFLTGLGIASVPVAVTVAILRYRLYDIDFLINRTLVYGSLTAFLAAVHYTLVVTLQGVVLGDGQRSSVVVAGSTLAVAALFRPARARIQSLIDRRFNRRRYDAARTIEAFSAQLRNEVDLDSLSRHLLAVVQETMEPSRVSLWLKASSR